MEELTVLETSWINGEVIFETCEFFFFFEFYRRSWWQAFRTCEWEPRGLLSGGAPASIPDLIRSEAPCPCPDRTDRGSPDNTQLSWGLWPGLVIQRSALIRVTWPFQKPFPLYWPLSPFSSLVKVAETPHHILKNKNKNRWWLRYQSSGPWPDSLQSRASLAEHLALVLFG